VHRGFERWEEAIGRPVRFQAVEDPARATLRVDLRAAMRDAPEGLVGGMAGDGAEHCRVTGPSDSDDRVEIEFALHDVTLFIADSIGLLTPRQVERLATHEIGHVLGASGQHSPMRGDVMFRMADDSRFETLSEHDQNSFRGLYRTPQGTIYARLSQTHSEPLAEARRVPPKLGFPVADDRFGFEVQFPRGWQTIQTQRGWVAVDGVSWDYDASLQVIALRGTREASRERQERAYRARGEILTAEVYEIDGQPVERLVVQSEGTTEETAIMDWGDGWVLFVVADCLTPNYDYYQRWFRNVLLSLHPLDGDAAN
jgi:hypothetical protein